MVKFDALKTVINVLRLWADGLFARKRDVALKSDIPTVPTTVSSFENDAGYLTAPATASVGQTVVVKAVDENGKPTEWEAADMQSGSGGGCFLIETTKHEQYSPTARVFNCVQSMDEVGAAFMAGCVLMLKAVHPVDVGTGNYVDEEWFYTFAGMQNGTLIFSAPLFDGSLEQLALSFNSGLIFDR